MPSKSTSTPYLSELRRVSINGPVTGQVLSYDGENWRNASLSGIGVTSVAGTANRITATTVSGAVTLNISPSYVGQASITTLGTITTGVWNGSAINLESYVTGVLPATSHPALTGDITTSSGSVTTTLATVNSNVGTFNTVTVNGKGLVTAASNTSYLTNNQTITISGDITGSGTTAITGTLATVNSNVGTFGSATQVPVFTVNAKGLITAASNTTITVPSGANPSVSVGLSAVNGSASTFMRSDGAPAISQSISPTWTGNHTFTPSSGTAATFNGANTGIKINSSAATAPCFFTPTGFDQWRLAAGSVNADDFGIYNVTRSKSVMEFVGGASGGNVKINAPTSGAALTVSGSTMLQGGFGTSITSTTSTSYTVPSTITRVVYYGGGTSTFTLPTATAGKEISITTLVAQAIVSASSNVAAIAGGALGTSILSATAGKWAVLVADGTYWNILMSN